MIGWLKRVFRPSPHVVAAMEDSRYRAEEAVRYRQRVEREIEPLHRALLANGFAPAVMDTFQRRPHR